MRGILGVLLVLGSPLLASVTQAQLVRVTSESKPHEVCQIINGQKQCVKVITTEYGTGVIVDRDAKYDYVLTAKHVLDFDDNSVHGRKSELVAKHPTEDLALLRTPATKYDIATMVDDPVIGLAVYLDGFGPNSGKADTTDYRRARGQVISSTTVSHTSRDGDSGGAIAVGSQLYGIITHSDATSTRFVPVSKCRTFCWQFGICRPPASQRVAPLPVPPPPLDVPDREKTARIAQLEKDLAALRDSVSRMTQKRETHPFDVLLVSYSKKDKREIVHGTVTIDPRNGGQHRLTLPDTTVQWLHHQTGKVESSGAFPAGTPVKLVVTPKMLGTGGKDAGSGSE